MYPSTIYRVVAKALIKDSQGRILVVKENSDFWSLPGGGIEHGESAQDCLKRELKEEIGISDVVVGDIAYSTTVYLDKRDLWMTWIVYTAELASHDFTYGDDVSGARFIDPAELAGTTHLLEKLILETLSAVKL